MTIAIKKHKPSPANNARGMSIAGAANDSGNVRKKQGHAKPLPIPEGLHDLARLRVGHLMNLLAISHATLYARLHTGSLPHPDGYDGKRPFWRTSTVREFLDRKASC